MLRHCAQHNLQFHVVDLNRPCCCCAWNLPMDWNWLRATLNICWPHRCARFITGFMRYDVILYWFIIKHWWMFFPMANIRRFFDQTTRSDVVRSGGVYRSRHCVDGDRLALHPDGLFRMLPQKVVCQNRHVCANCSVLATCWLDYFRRLIRSIQGRQLHNHSRRWLLHAIPTTIPKLEPPTSWRHRLQNLWTKHGGVQSLIHVHIRMGWWHCHRIHDLRLDRFLHRRPSGTKEIIVSRLMVQLPPRFWKILNTLLGGKTSHKSLVKKSMNHRSLHVPP